MNKTAITLFQQRHKAIRKEKAITINLFLMGTFQCSYLSYWVLSS